MKKLLLIPLLSLSLLGGCKSSNLSFNKDASQGGVASQSKCGSASKSLNQPPLSVGSPDDCENSAGPSEEAGLKPQGASEAPGGGTMGSPQVPPSEAGGGSCDAGKTLASYELREYFGVSHPSQVVEMELPAALPANCQFHLVNAKDNSAEVAQALSNHKIAFVTDLPANGSRSWKLVAGPAPSSPAGAETVAVKESDAFIEISNGITGVRVPKTLRDAEAIQKGSAAKDVKHPLSPIQGIQYQSGTWTATGPNYLDDSIKNFWEAWHWYLKASQGAPEKPGPMEAPKDFAPLGDIEVKFLEKGPVLTRVQLSYKFHREAYNGGKQLPADDAGFLTTTVEIQKGQPSILIEDHTNMDIYYRMNVYDGLQPDIGRYVSRAGASDIQYGYTYDASKNKVKYDSTGWHKGDAYVDLNYDYTHYAMWMASAVSYPFTTLHNPWGDANTGSYWQLYKSSDGPQGNLIGVFNGAISRALGQNGHSGAGIYTSYRLGANNQKIPEAGFASMHTRDKPDASFHEEGRHAWGIFVGSKGKDLSETERIQNIRRNQNIHSGINLNKLISYKVDYYDAVEAPFEKKLPFIGSAEMGSFLKALEGQANTTDLPLKDLYTLLYVKTEDPVSKLPPIPHFVKHMGKLSAMWLDPKSETVNYREDALNSLVNLDGVYNGDRFVEYHGMTQMWDSALKGNLLLALGKVGPEEAKQIKRYIALFANIANDLDYAPIGITGTVHGTENQTYMTTYYRRQLALIPDQHPMLQAITAKIPEEMMKDIEQAINEAGAISSSSGDYIAATMPPFLNISQELKAKGRFGELTKLDSAQRLEKSASFLLNLLVSDVRRGVKPSAALPGFGEGASPGYGTKGIMPFGDAVPFVTEHLFGLYGTLFKGINDTLSANLMWAWTASGSGNTTWLSNTYFQVDPNLPQSAPKLGNADIPGYYSVLRNSFDTAQETVCFMINGSHYRDHAHPDMGSVACHALGFPLMRDYSGYYQSRDMRLHSLAYVEPIPSTKNAAGVPWASGDADELVKDEYASRSRPVPSNRVFLPFLDSGYVSTDFQEPPKYEPANLKNLQVPLWTRELISIHPNPALPILLVKDSFSGGNAAYDNLGKVVSFAFMAEPKTPVKVEGQADYPAPEFRLNTLSLKKDIGPSSGPIRSLGGTWTRLGFQGQGFNLQANDAGNAGIDWSAYVLNSGDPSMEMIIGDWGFAPNWYPFKLQSDWQVYEEYQYILRLHGKGPFEVLLLPYKKGQAPRTAQYANGKITVADGSAKTYIYGDYYGYQDPDKTVLGKFSEEATPVSEFSMTIEGGPAEIVVTADKAIVSVSGKAGLRSLTLPDPGAGKTWSSSQLQKESPLSFKVDYAGGEPQTFAIEKK